MKTRTSVKAGSSYGPLAGVSRPIVNDPPVMLKVRLPRLDVAGFQG